MSFKTGVVSASRLNLKRGNIEQGIRAQLEEDDERMVDFDPNKASTFRRRNSPIPGSARNKAKGLVENGSGWFQVTVSKTKSLILILASFDTISLTTITNTISFCVFTDSSWQQI